MTTSEMPSSNLKQSGNSQKKYSIKVLEEFICRLYVIHSEICDVNEMRFELFRMKDGNVESEQLPPLPGLSPSTHASRTNYQASIWKRELQADSHILRPLECKRWSLGDKGELVITWMTGAPGLDPVLELLSCKCKKSCKVPSCQCI